MLSEESKQNLSESLAAIWQTLRIHGHVDESRFLGFTLGIFFYRFISETINLFVNETENRTGNGKFNFSALSDKKAELFRDQTLKKKGFFIYPSELFENVRKMTDSDKNLDETLAAIFKNIETSAQNSKNNNSLNGLFDFSIFKSKLSDKISWELLKAIGDIPLNMNANSDSLEQYANVLELLMDSFSKSAPIGWSTRTPQELSELMVRIAVVGKKKVDKVYDPACGSGTLLLKFGEILGKDNIRNGFFGQDIDKNSYNLCRLNMLLHGLNIGQFDIALGSTLDAPLHENLKPFEAIVSDPPYSCHWEGDSSARLASDERFSPAGVLAPESKSDFAFIMHSLSWLADNGTAAVVTYPGAMYRRGREQRIRKYLIDNNYVDSVIQLPINLHSGSHISFCILVMKKNKTDSEVLFIDASKEFNHDSKLNKLNPNHLNKIVDSYANRENRIHFSRLVGSEEIADSDYNLTVGSYVEPEYYGELVDIDDLDAEIEDIVSRQISLRTEVQAIIADLKGGVA